MINIASQLLVTLIQHSAGSANTTSNQVDLFGESLVDLMDAPTSLPSESATFNKSETHEVDLFADATFVSAPPHAEAATVSHDQVGFAILHLGLTDYPHLIFPWYKQCVSHCISEFLFALCDMVHIDITCFI